MDQLLTFLAVAIVLPLGTLALFRFLTPRGEATSKKAGPVLFSTLAIQRYAKLEEVAAGVVFLASPAASYITGAVLISTAVIPLKPRHSKQ